MKLPHRKTKKKHRKRMNARELHRRETIKARRPIVHEMSRQAYQRSGGSNKTINANIRNNAGVRTASVTTGTTLLQTTRVN